MADEKLSEWWKVPGYSPRKPSSGVQWWKIPTAPKRLTPESRPSEIEIAEPAMASRAYEMVTGLQPGTMDVLATPLKNLEGEPTVGDLQQKHGTWLDKTPARAWRGFKPGVFKEMARGYPQIREIEKALRKEGLSEEQAAEEMTALLKAGGAEGVHKWSEKHPYIARGLGAVHVVDFMGTMGLIRGAGKKIAREAAERVPQIAKTAATAAGASAAIQGKDILGGAREKFSAKDLGIDMASMGLGHVASRMAGNPTWWKTATQAEIASTVAGMGAMSASGQLLHRLTAGKGADKPPPVKWGPEIFGVGLDALTAGLTHRAAPKLRPFRHGKEGKFTEYILGKVEQATRRPDKPLKPSEEASLRQWAREVAKNELPPERSSKAHQAANILEESPIWEIAGAKGKVRALAPWETKVFSEGLRNGRYRIQDVRAGRGYAEIMLSRGKGKADRVRSLRLVDPLGEWRFAKLYDITPQAARKGPHYNRLRQVLFARSVDNMLRKDLPGAISKGLEGLTSFIFRRPEWGGWVRGHWDAAWGVGLPKAIKGLTEEGNRLYQATEARIYEILRQWNDLKGRYPQHGALLDQVFVMMVEGRGSPLPAFYGEKLISELRRPVEALRKEFTEVGKLMVKYEMMSEASRQKFIDETGTSTYSPRFYVDKKNSQAFLNAALSDLKLGRRMKSWGSFSPSAVVEMLKMVKHRGLTQTEAERRGLAFDAERSIAGALTEWKGVHKLQFFERVAKVGVKEGWIRPKEAKKEGAELYRVTQELIGEANANIEAHLGLMNRKGYRVMTTPEGLARGDRVSPFQGPWTERVSQEPMGPGRTLPRKEPTKPATPDQVQDSVLRRRYLQEIGRNELVDVAKRLGIDPQNVLSRDLVNQIIHKEYPASARRAKKQGLHRMQADPKARPDSRKHLRAELEANRKLEHLQDTAYWLRREQTGWARIPDAKEWGPLRGMLLRNDIYQQIKHLPAEVGAYLRAWDATISMVKKNLTSRNPVVHMANTGGNFLANDLMGVSMVAGWKNLAEAMVHTAKWARGEKVNDKLFEVFQRSGLLGAVDPTKAEFMSNLTAGDFPSVIDKAMKQNRSPGEAFAMLFERFIHSIDRFHEKALEPLKIEKAYPMEDVIMAYALFRGLMTGRGSHFEPFQKYGETGIQDALDTVRSFYSYADLPPTIKGRGILGRRGLWSFSSFQMKVLQGIPRAALLRPVPLIPTTKSSKKYTPRYLGDPLKKTHRAASWAANASVASWHAFGKFALSIGLANLMVKNALFPEVNDEQWERMTKAASHGDNIKQMFRLLVGRDASGDPVYFDIFGWIPWLTISKIGQSGNTDWPAMADWLSRNNVVLGPLIHGVIRGEDYFGKPISGLERIHKGVTRTWVPGIIQTPGEMLVRRASGRGRADLLEILGRSVGVKFYRGDPTYADEVEFWKLYRAGEYKRGNYYTPLTLDAWKNQKWRSFFNRLRARKRGYVPKSTLAQILEEEG